MSIEISALEPLTTPSLSDKLIVYDEDSDNEYKTESITIGNLIAGLSFLLNPQKYTAYEGSATNIPDISINKLNAYNITGGTANVYFPVASSVPLYSGTIVYVCDGSVNVTVNVASSSDDVFYLRNSSYTSLTLADESCILFFTLSDGYLVLEFA